VSGSYQALLTAGELRLIRNDRLRAQVVAYTASLAHERDMLFLFMQEVIGSAGPLARALPFVRSIFIEDPDSIRANGYDFGAHRNDPELAALLLTLQAANTNRLTHLKILRDETSQMLQTLEAEPALRNARMQSAAAR
jgi:hypothetical protein